MKKQGFGYQQSQVAQTVEWLTPPELIKSLGEFDLDPCSPVNRPWDTAKKHYNKDDNGLIQPWSGRVYLNPPYGAEVWEWLNHLSIHKNGVALIFARTGAIGFTEQVWDKAYGLLFIKKRIHFYSGDGIRAKHNSGGDSVLIAYDAMNYQSFDRQ